MKHLRRDDYRLFALDALLHYHALCRRYALSWDLNSQVSTCHHYPVCVIKNLVYIINPLLIFNLCNDTRIAPLPSHEFFHTFYILTRTHEGMRYKTNVLLSRYAQELFISFAQSG